MPDDGNISDVSEDPDFVPFELPSLETTSIFDLRKVSGTTNISIPVMSQISIGIGGSSTSAPKSPRSQQEPKNASFGPRSTTCVAETQREREKADQQ